MPPTVLLRSEESAGAVSVIEVASGPGFTGPHLHRHDFDEAFYVLEGELTFQLRDEVFARGAGQLAFAPRGGGIAADRDGIEPPDWALQDIPAVERLGPPIGQQEPSG